MKQALNFWLLGGDLRQEKLAGLLREDGHSVHTYALESGDMPGEKDLRGVEYANCVVLPLPVSVEAGLLNSPTGGGTYSLKEIFAALDPGQFICGGMVTDAVRALAEEQGLRVHDYFRREELAVANAVPAA